MTNDTADLESALRHGLRWLYDTPQPDGAALQHHGESLYLRPQNRSIRFVPTGWHRHVVLVLDVAKVDWPEGAFAQPRNTFEVGEFEAFKTLLGRMGHHVCDSWNGELITGSVALSRPAHESLVKAVDQYYYGCPEHPDKGVFCKCPWFRDANAKIVHLRDVAAGGDQ